INRGAWEPRYAEYSTANMFYWPQGYECNWRWWPADENAKPPQLMIAYLKQSFLEKIAIEILDVEPGCVELLNKIGVRDEFARQLILAVRNELAQGNPCGPVYAETAAQMLALHAISKHCSLNHRIKICRGGLSKSQLRRALDYIDSHLHEEISLEIMASLTGLTSYHFLRLFKRSTGKTPLQFIIHARMEKAKELLAARVSVTYVAMDVGYESVSHFITLFKRHTGVTPLEYQRKL
ncbi:MAG TPA: AraC family transcriptional regulator, partial [Gammaproteobacteria bacterium]